MSKILVTSCKGGVGKSTVSANLATALSLEGKRVLLIDFDLANRSLDLMLDMQDNLLYDICDLACGRVDCESVVAMHPDYPNLAFINAPFIYSDHIEAGDFGRALSRLDEVYSFDFIIIDTSGGAHESVALSAPICDSAIIVSSQNPTSIRAAEKSGMILDEAGLYDQYLIINGFDTERESIKQRAGIIDIIDRTRTALYGVVPMDARVTLLAEKGRTVFAGDCGNCKVAFTNIAKRLCGANVPLMSGFKGIKRKKFLFN